MANTYVPSGFTVDAFLCDSVVTAEGKIYIQGGGWNTLNSATFPIARDRVGIAAVISVPYNETNKQHELELWLEDQDGARKPLGVTPGPDGTPQRNMKLVARFAAGRPPLLQAGEPQSMPFAVNLDNMVFETPGRYAFVLTINGEEMSRLAFRVVSPDGFVVNV